MKCIVIGSGLGGLSAAINAKRRGYDVVVLEKNKIIGGKAGQIFEQGFTFDPGPSIIMLTDVYKSIFSSFDKDFDAYVELVKLPTISRLVIENGKIYDLPTGKENFLDFVSDNFNQDVDAVKKYFQICEAMYALIQETSFKKPIDSIIDILKTPKILKLAKYAFINKPFKEVTDSFFKSAILRAYFYGFPGFTGQSYMDSSPGGFMVLYLLVTQGVFYPMGGVGQIPNAFYQLAKELGVEFATETEIEKFTVNNKTIESVTDKKGNVYSADYFISNIDKLTMESFFEIKKNKKHSPSYSYFTYHLGIKKKLVDLDLHNIFIPNNFDKYYEDLYIKSQLSENPILYINMPSSLDTSIAPKNMDSLFCVLTVPPVLDSINWEEQLIEAKKYFLDNINKYGINIKSEDIVLDRVQTPIYFRDKHLNYLGGLFGPITKERNFMGFPLSNRDKTYSNLYYAGGTVQPGGGLPMVALSGKFATLNLPLSI